MELALAAVVLDFVGVVVTVCVFCEEELAAFVAVVLNGRIHFLPRPEERHVQVNPRYESSLGVGVELHALVSLFEHLH